MSQTRRLAAILAADVAGYSRSGRGRHARTLEGFARRAFRPENRRASRAVSSKPPATGCWWNSPDIVLDAIADPEGQADTGLRISKPYYRGGVGLAVPYGSSLAGFASLDGRTKVGVQVGSVAAMMLNQQHVRVSSFGFEEDILEALASGGIDAGAATPLAARLLQSDPSLSGIRRPAP